LLHLVLTCFYHDNQSAQLKIKPPATPFVSVYINKACVIYFYKKGDRPT